MMCFLKVPFLGVAARKPPRFSRSLRLFGVMFTHKPYVYSELVGLPSVSLGPIQQVLVSSTLRFGACLINFLGLLVSHHLLADVSVW